MPMHGVANWDRRQFLRGGILGGAVLLGASGCQTRETPVVESTPADAPMAFPGKVPMRVLNHRPPCLETPWEYFNHDVTPNEAFYVRWHLQMLPTTIDLRSWRLRIGGVIEKPVELTHAELRKMPAHSLYAVNQCSGNSRGLFEPHMPGAQWGNGAMGNAKWTGVRLRDLLDKVGIKTGGIEVSFAGMDRGGLPSVPDFVKTLPIEETRREDILLAYAMNDEPIPILNGFPLRLIVPGWYATYWVKAVDTIMVLDKPFDGFWMKTAYRIPETKNALEIPGKLATTTIPINRMNVRSFFTFPAQNARLQDKKPIELSGIAFDGGDGIAKVEVSLDEGNAWQQAKLGKDLGKYSFRRWTMEWTPQKTGTGKLLVRATTTTGQTQPMKVGWNRAGYMRNVIEQLQVEVV